MSGEMIYDISIAILILAAWLHTEFGSRPDRSDDSTGGSGSGS